MSFGRGAMGFYAVLMGLDGMLGCAEVTVEFAVRRKAWIG
jgi:hypothetical protein